ncbi:bacteriocin immunity protein [Companilactobacillus sp. HBUAS56275]|uniref:bacteriocin immunity protein n=1 Tax=Companilactobacillus sp. HBUAS56275 TaxID=3109364 RepID=UPI002FF12289
MLKNRKLKLEDLITTALDDKAVQNDGELTEILRNAQSKLDKGNAENIVATKLEHSISTYTLTHNLKAPKSIVELSQFLQNDANKYKGFMSILTWFAN